MRLALDAFAAQGGVGGHHAVHAMAPQCGRNHVNLRGVQIWRDLDKDGYAHAMALHQSLASERNGAEQGVQRRIALQGSQVLGVGARYIDRHVIGMGVNPVKTLQVVFSGALDWGGRVFANVQAQQHRG